jgi:hypothetical protein
VYSVYRQRNAEVLRRLLAPARAAGWTVALWALDDPDDSLATYTFGSGTGTKFDLINRLLSERPVGPDQPIVVVDDDVKFVRGNLVLFLRTMAAAELDLAQPAHVRWSNISHRITLMSLISRARLTSFVEIGPIFAVWPGWRDRIAPFPEGLGMGWGLELDWMDLRADGCRLGIVDATPICHLSPVASDYVQDSELAKLTRRLEERGAPDWGGLRQTLSTWRPWQERAPWVKRID